MTSTFRTAGCGPACPVVWEGIGRETPGRPYPDCYRPLRKPFPHSVSVFITFLICGFLHDLLYMIPMWLRDGSMPLPFMACWSSTIAICILVTAPLGICFHGIRPLARVPIHVGFLAATFSLAIYVERVT